MLLPLEFSALRSRIPHSIIFQAQHMKRNPGSSDLQGIGILEGHCAIEITTSVTTHAPLPRAFRSMDNLCKLGLCFTNLQFNAFLNYASADCGFFSVPMVPGGLAFSALHFWILFLSVLFRCMTNRCHRFWTIQCVASHTLATTKIAPQYLA